MVCVALTRGGEGSLWRFESLIEASDHPLIQYGDAICCSEEDVHRTFRPVELADLADRIGQPQLSLAIRSSVAILTTRDRDQFAERLWSHMQRSAVEPPKDPSEVIRLVRQDRAAARSARSTPWRLNPMERLPLQQRNERMTDDTEKKTAVPRTRKYSDTTIISMGKDANGVAYGPENNPKKVGSKSAERFAKYVDGMTVETARAVGFASMDFDYDSEKGFISLS